MSKPKPQSRTRRAAKRPTAADDELKRRAFAAYFRSNADMRHDVQPDAALSSVEILDGKQYVVLRHAGGILACYRVRNDGMLKRLVRIPHELRGDEE